MAGCPEEPEAIDSGFPSFFTRIRMSHTAITTAALTTALILSLPVARAAGDAPPSLHAAAKEAPAYDEKADAKADLVKAIAKAKAGRKKVLVVFGANWCPDCRALAAQMKSDSVARRVGKSFVVTKVEIGNWDRNMDIAERFGNPTRKGIPAVAVLDAKGKLIRATAAGELASARAMGEDQVLAVFDKLAAH